LGLLDFFKKRSPEEQFQEAIEEKDYITIVNLGKELLSRHPDSLSILNPYVEALVKLGKKDEAVNLLLSYAEKKIRDEYFELAIPVLKRALKIDPLNIRAAMLLADAYKKKELYYDAFKVLTDAYEKFRVSGIPTSRIKELLESFIQEQFHPIFYEKYGDILAQEGQKDEAVVNLVMAANMFMNLKNYKAALRALLKAQRLNRTESIDRQIVEAAAYLGTNNVIPVIVTLLNNYKDEPDFIRATVEIFKEAGNLKLLKEIAQNIKNPKLQYALLALINYELGEVEEGREYLNKLRLIDANMYEKLAAAIKARHGIDETAIGFPAHEELPEPEQILEVLEQAIDLGPSLDLEELVNEWTSHIDVEEKPEDLKAEIVTLKEMDKDGSRYTSMAEALLGLEKYDEAIEAAKKALNTNQSGKAVLLIGEAYRLKGDYKGALTFLLDQLQNPNLSEVDKARIKVLMGEIYEERGNLEKALYWYREANKLLKDEELKRKIEEIEANERI